MQAHILIGPRCPFAIPRVSRCRSQTWHLPHLGISSFCTCEADARQSLLVEFLCLASDFPPLVSSCWHFFFLQLTKSPKPRHFNYVVTRLAKKQGIDSQQTTLHQRY